MWGGGEGVGEGSVWGGGSEGVGGKGVCGEEVPQAKL